MDFNNIGQALLEAVQALTPLEIGAFVSLTAYVLLATRQVPLAWPVSMVGVVLYAIIAYRSQLYAELPLQVFYFSISIYGWYYWKHGGRADTSLPVTTTSGSLALRLLALAAVGTVLTGYFLDHLGGVLTALGLPGVESYFVPTDVPYWDAFTTIFSLAGTWLQAKKKIENWLVWLVVDSVYVWLFIYKGFYLIALLNILYLGFATYGLWAWRQSMRGKSGCISEKSIDL